MEHHFGAPQDIEWAADESSTWILQSRPITTLINENHSAAEHLGENVPPGDLRIWDNSNIIESFAGVTSPLTFTTARKLYADVYRAYARSLKVPSAQLDQMEPWLPVMLGQFNGHVYYNLLHWYRMVGIAPGYPLNRRVLEVALGVSEPLDRRTAGALRPFGFSNALVKGFSRARTTITYARRFWSLDALVARFDSSFEEFVDRHGLTDVSELDGPGAYRLFRRIHDDLADIWGPMMVLDAILVTSVGVLAALTKTFLPRAPEWFGFAVVNPGTDVVSIEPARALADIAAFARDHADLWAFIDAADPDVAYPLLVDHAGDADAPHWRELLGKIDEYIDRFGYRCLDELKLEAPDLRQDPSGIFHMLRMASAEETQRAGDSAQAYLDAHLHGPRRKVFDALRRKIQRAATHREHLRFSRTQGFGILKSLVAVMGRDLEQRGIVEESADVFLLRLDELFAVYEGSMSRGAARQVIARRGVLHEGYRKAQCARPVRHHGSGLLPGGTDEGRMAVVRGCDTGAGRDRAQRHAVQPRGGDRTRGGRGEAAGLLQRHPRRLSHRPRLGGGTSLRVRAAHRTRIAAHPCRDHRPRTGSADRRADRRFDQRDPDRHDRQRGRCQRPHRPAGRPARPSEIRCVNLPRPTSSASVAG